MKKEEKIILKNLNGSKSFQNYLLIKEFHSFAQTIVCLLLLKVVPSSGFKSCVHDLIIALFSFQRTPLLVILLQYCVASSSPSVNILFMYVSVRFVVAPCLATKSLRNNTNFSAPRSRQKSLRVCTDFQASRFVSQLLYNILVFCFCQEVFKIFFIIGSTL